MNGEPDRRVRDRAAETVIAPFPVSPGGRCAYQCSAPGAAAARRALPSLGRGRGWRWWAALAVCVVLVSGCSGGGSAAPAAPAALSSVAAALGTAAAVAA